jgi:hypothetical protein
MPDREDDVVNVDMEPEDALRVLLETEYREPVEETSAEGEDESFDSGTGTAS